MHHCPPSIRWWFGMVTIWWFTLFPLSLTFPNKSRAPPPRFPCSGQSQTSVFGLRWQLNKPSGMQRIFNCSLFHFLPLFHTFSPSNNRTFYSSAPRKLMSTRSKIVKSIVQPSLRHRSNQPVELEWTGNWIQRESMESQIVEAKLGIYAYDDIDSAERAFMSYHRITSSSTTTTGRGKWF